MNNKMIKKNFCPAPWTEVFINWDSSGPCCVNNKIYKGLNPEKYLKSKELKDIKKQFLIGDRPKSCDACWTAEDAGVSSVRQTQTTVGSKLQRVSLAITNKCNFKCRMCNPIDSDAWVKDKKALELYKSYYNNIDIYSSIRKVGDDYQSIDWIIEQCKTKKLLVNLLGGEPFISLGFLYFLKKVKEYNLYDNISLVITTNLSVTKYKGVDFTEELKKFKRLDIYASIDGCFKVGEYIREGFNFTKFHNNLMSMKSLVTHFSVTLQVYNVYDMPNIFRYANTLGIKINLNYMFDPLHLKVEILSTEERQKVLKYYESKNFTNKSIINVLETGDDYTTYRAKYIEWTDTLDKLWNKNIKDYIPELSSLSH
tara:strand:- start:54 stop:1157 length:1104 start_codon:yes stop_codon:yes gene_type:complete